MMSAVPDDVAALIFQQTSHHCENNEQHHFESNEKHHFAKRYIIKLKKDVTNLKENKLAELSMDFSVDIINLVKRLKGMKEPIISNQIGRCGTSIGANIHEAQYAQSKRDFISKFEIALKEVNETGYWLNLLFKTNYIDEATFKSLSSKCTTLRVMLITSCKTAKEK